MEHHPFVCTQCGAPMQTWTCEYCGTRYGLPHEEEKLLAVKLFQAGVITANEVPGYIQTGKMTVERDAARRESRIRFDADYTRGARTEGK